MVLNQIIPLNIGINGLKNNIKIVKLLKNKKISANFAKDSRIHSNQATFLH